MKSGRAEELPINADGRRLDPKGAATYAGSRAVASGPEGAAGGSKPRRRKTLTRLRTTAGEIPRPAAMRVVLRPD